MVNILFLVISGASTGAFSIALGISQISINNALTGSMAGSKSGAGSGSITR